MPQNFKKDIIGRRYGALEIIGRTNRSDNGGRYYYRCRCHACGNESYEGLLSTLYQSKSCGCSRRAPIGHRIQRKDGYVAVKVAEGEYRREHQVVMEKMLERPLLPSESVHHINGDKADNRPENLELWASTQPAGQRVTDLVQWAEEILSLYGQRR